MMKLSSVVVSLVLSAIIGIAFAAPCLQGSFDLDVQVVENATHTLSCKEEFFSAFEAKMQASGCDTTRGKAVKNELLDLLNTNESLSSYVDSVCEHAMTRQAAAETFDTIASQATRPLDMKEYYDGGTYLNEEIGSLVVDGAFIDEVFQDSAQDKLIEFPSDMYNFQSSKANAVVCCWVQDRHDENAANNGDCRQPYETACIDKDPMDNTDVCYVNLKRSKKSNHVAGGKAIYHDRFDKRNSETEGPTHCHGFAWHKNQDSPSFRYRGNNLFYVSLYDHLLQRGYIRNVPGAPMCSVVEKAAVVSRSDCTEMAVTETFTFSYNDATKELSATISDVNIAYNACTGIVKDNDLEDYYSRLVRDGQLKVKKQRVFEQTIVGKNQCPSAILSFMEDSGWQRIPAE